MPKSRKKKAPKRNMPLQGRQLQGEWSNASYTAGTGYPNAQGQEGASTVPDSGRAPHRASRLLGHQRESELLRDLVEPR